jgi:hypothetical protein
LRRPALAIDGRGIPGRAKERETAGLKTRVNAALIGRLERGGKGREGGRARRESRRRRPGETEEGEKKKGRGRGRLTGGTGMSARQGKGKRRQRSWAAAGERIVGCWAVEPKR